MIQLEATQHTLHFRKPAATSRGALTKRVLWLIEATDSETGARGMGEVGVVPGLSIDDLPDLGERIERFVNDFNQIGARIIYHGDLRAELGAFYERINALPALSFGASCALGAMLAGDGFPYPSDFVFGHVGLKMHGLIWMDTPEGMLAQVRAKVGAGFDVIKMKVGALPWEEELRLLRQVRSEFPEIELRLDANRAFPRNETEARLDALAPLEIAFLEEPALCASLDDYALLIERSPVPICLDETLIPAVATNSVGEVVRHLRPAHVIIKPSLLGGLARCDEVIRMSDKLRIQWWINSLLESAVGHSAICQYTAARDLRRTHGLGTGSLYVNNFPSPIRLEGNRLWWRDAPKGA